MKKTISLVITVVVVLYLSGCETAKGVGQDLENSGKNIKQTIEKNE